MNKNNNLIGVSFIICTYNGEKNIIKTIEYLRQIDLTHNYEIIIVDNNSNDSTALMVNEYIKNNPDVNIFYCFEHQQGLLYARKKGYYLAKYPYISFIDDDNFVISTNWIDKIINIFERKPEVGIIGVKSEAQFEVAPPPWFNKICRAFAVGEQYPSSGILEDNKINYIWGAGMSIRKSLLASFFYELEKYSNYVLEGRKANALTSGEDGLLCLFALKSGYKLYYENELEIIHYITKERLNKQRAFELMYNLGKNQMQLRFHPFNPFNKHFSRQKDFIWVLFQYMKCSLKLDLFKKYYYKGTISYYINFIK